MHSAVKEKQVHAADEVWALEAKSVRERVSAKQRLLRQLCKQISDGHWRSLLKELHFTVASLLNKLRLNMCMTSWSQLHPYSVLVLYSIQVCSCKMHTIKTLLSSVDLLNVVINRFLQKKKRVQYFTVERQTDATPPSAQLWCYPAICCTMLLAIEFDRI